ncbi:phosphatase PAP2 family protein [archaeon]|jgi:membrane-associated phospholipid phosphatase|nr:phosphatase PAP2 family protein [archaeon]
MTIDTATNALMQQIQNPFLTSISKLIAFITDPIVLLIAALIIASYLYTKKQNKKATIFASAIIITAILIKLSKAIFQRARPANALVQELTQSFPSGHATMAVIFFGLVAYMFARKKYKPATVITTLIILIIAFTRIYLNVHWLTDIIAGLALGTAILILSILALKKS